LQFDSQAIGPIYFTIGGLMDPATETFDDFTNSVPTDRCGDREYFVFEGHSSLTFDSALRKFEVTTTDPTDVGTHEITLLVQLKEARYQQFNPVVYMM